MSSQNIDENAMLKYVCFCLQIWGISYIDKDILKKARENSAQTCHPLTHLLFDLITLQIVDFAYTVTELGIKLDPRQEDTVVFMQEFVLAYLSEMGCPYLRNGDEDRGDQHVLDFGHARGLLLVVGWFMARVEFFGQIRSKFVSRKFNDLYIQRKIKPSVKGKQNNGLSMGSQKLRPPTPLNQDNKSLAIERLYKQLTLHQFRISCLDRKKTQILTKLTKELVQYNKKNDTSFKIDTILAERGNEDMEGVERQEQELEMVLGEMNRGMKYQQYFWMWLQYKVIQTQYKHLQAEYPQFQKVQGQSVTKPLRMNPDYLSMYTKQYNTISTRMQYLNQYIQSIQPWLSSVKGVKNEAAIAKEVHNDCERILRQGHGQVNGELVEMVGMPCFLKVEARKWFEKHGFGSKIKKSKKKKGNNVEKQEPSKQVLKQEIQEFVSRLEQIKFL